MHTALTYMRTLLRRSDERADELRAAASCSWDVMRATYEEQAARGIPEAVQGLELIEQGRWPTSGRLREGSEVTDG